MLVKAVTEGLHFLPLINQKHKSESSRNVINNVGPKAHFVCHKAASV